MSDVKEILEGWQEQGIAFVRFELPDMHGISRSKTIPIRHAADYAERGLNMYGGTSVLDTRSDVVGGTLYHEERGYGDQLLFPDPATAAIVPWIAGTARFICDAQWPDGAPLAATPRHVFRRVLDRCRWMGFEPLMGSEFEFYLLEPETRASPCSPGITSSTRSGTIRSRRSTQDHRGSCPRSASTSSPRTASTPGRSGRSTSRRAGGSPAPTSRSRSRTA